jgi:hypothetical protein
MFTAGVNSYRKDNEPFQRVFRLEAIRRIVPNVIVIFVIWPLLTAFSAVVIIRNNPYVPLKWSNSVIAALGGMVILLPDFLVIGSFLAMLSILVFSALVAKKWVTLKFFSLLAEPGVVLFSMLLGTSLFYPAVLNHPALAMFGSLPVWLDVSLIGVTVFSVCYYLAVPGVRFRACIIVMVLGILSPVPVSMYRFHGSSKTGKPPLVMLGLDSVSDKDDLIPLKDWVARNNGTYYHYAVTPGLYTNSVWTSIISMLPVKEHGVCYICQSYPKLKDNENLIERAKETGYWTVAVFPDQTTEWSSIQAGFDENRSGPVGWRQFATSTVENASILLPIFRPLLPRLTKPGVPPNHAGTFTYSLDRELDEIFSRGIPGRSVFICAHLTYLHSISYPGLMKLSRSEYADVLCAKVRSVVDRSFFWQDVDLPTDAIQLHRWKEMRLQRAVMESVKRTGFFKRGGKLLLFSDHGNRAGLTMDNFCQERYYHVPLATFNLPPQNPEHPISLIDAGKLLGLEPNKPPSLPVVEYSTAQRSDWSILAKNAHIRWDGRVDLDNNILKAIFDRLRACDPYNSTEHAVTPVQKVENGLAQEE